MFSIPTKAVAFGTKVPVDFEMIPLLKGLKLGEIKTELQELYHLSADGAPKKEFQSMDITVSSDVWAFPADRELEDIGGQDGWRFSRTVQIPMSLKKCRQSVEVNGVTIKHKMRFTICLLNPDGHTSEVNIPCPMFRPWLISKSSEQSFPCKYLFRRTFSLMRTIIWSIRWLRPRRWPTI
jgi:hypothetical protein